jgi:2Fe-2S ferredoxin
MPRVTFLPAQTAVEVPSGTTVLDAALDHDIPLNHNCGGNCACSTCHVIVESGFESLNPVTDDELEMLEEAENLTAHSRLACQSIVTEDLVVRIPPGRVI